MLTYTPPLFRPPSEAKSLILQVTLGCSWNKCSFCEMYTTKQFQPRNFDNIKKDIEQAQSEWPSPDKIFLADGDALVLSKNKLLPILELLHAKFPKVKQISSYATPQNVLKKSDQDLADIHAAGLNMLYYGVESGDNVILNKIQKGVDAQGVCDGIIKARGAGFKISTTNLLGIAGKKYTKQHALNTAKILSQANPEYISFLMIMFPLGDERFLNAFGNDYEALDQLELIQELRNTLANLEVKDSEIRANHASNYLPIKALFPKDKVATLAVIDDVLNNPDPSKLRPEFLRGL
ncbi:MAG: radical SAM protein [bacterium]|nr:radical SAM protein [bacterium]MBU1918330.1 radical SAM protein [bacterium]